MSLRLWFLLITCLWVTMNVLLWHREFYQANEGSAMSAAAVWEKVVTAPDDSSLRIYRGERQIGFCRWRTAVASGVGMDELPARRSLPEEMVRDPQGYTLSAEGNLGLAEDGKRVRFHFNANLRDLREWEDFLFSLSVTSRKIELLGSARDREVRVTWQDGDQARQWEYSMEELRQPSRLLRDFGVLPWAPVQDLLPKELLELDESQLQVDWEARTDWLSIGSAKVRVYKVRARLLGRYSAEILVSRVGEILRVDLPGRVQLRNEILEL